MFLNHEVTFQFFQIDMFTGSPREGGQNTERKASSELRPQSVSAVVFPRQFGLGLQSPAPTQEFICWKEVANAQPGTLGLELRSARHKFGRSAPPLEHIHVMQKAHGPSPESQGRDP